MAKKRIEQENDEMQDEDQPISYENVEPEALKVSDDISDIPGDQNAPPYAPADLEMPFTGGDYGEQGPTQLDAPVAQPDERPYRVSFALPYGVLVHLIDP